MNSQRAMGVTLLLAAATLAAGAGAPPATKPASIGIDVSPATTVLTGPLRADGTVDYVAALNARDGAGITPENNAMALLIRIEPVGDAPNKEQFSDVRKALGVPKEAETANWNDARTVNAKGELDAWNSTTAQYTPWSAEENPKLAGWLKDNEPAMKILVESSKRPHYWLPAVPTPVTGMLEPYMGYGLIDNPHIHVRSQWSLALRIRAMLSLHLSDPVSTWEDLAAAHRIDRLLAGSMDTIDAASAMAGEMYDCKADLALLQQGGVPAATLQDMAQELSQVRFQPDWDEMRQRILYRYLDLVQMFAANFQRAADNRPPQFTDAQAKLILQAAGLMTPDWNRMMKMGVNLYAELRLASDSSLTDAQRAGHKKTAQDINDSLNLATKGDPEDTWPLPESGETREAYSDRLGAHTLLVLTTNFGSMPARAATANERLAWTAVAVALARYRLDHGAYPDAITALVDAKYLKSLPAENPATKMQYNCTGEGCELTDLPKGTKETPLNFVLKLPK